jgi:selenium-binding protein 1
VDEQIHPDGYWMVKLDADLNGGMKLDEKFFVEFDGLRAHQVRLEGGDASSDSTATQRRDDLTRRHGTDA